MSTQYKHDKTAHTNLAWVVTVSAALFFFYEFFQMNFFNAINGQLRSTFHLDAVQIGQLFSMYFYANFLCLFPAGNLLDRFSTKRLLVFAISICTIGTFIFAISPTFKIAAMGRFLVGCGASFCFLACIRLASRWFPPHKMALVTGVVVTMAMIGGLVAQAPFAALVNSLGNWRHAVLIDAALGIVILLVTLFVVQDRPPDAKEAAIADNAQLKALGVWRCIKLAMTNPQNWFGGIYTALINLPVFILGGLWGILYLTRVHHLTDTQASYTTTIFFVGVIFGSLAFGWFSDFIERRVLPMILGALLSLISILVLMYTPHLSFSALVILFFIVGFVTSSQVLSYPTIAELNPIYLTSTAVSIDSLCIMASGFIFPPFFGWLMERSGSEHIVNGIEVYTVQDFNHAMLIMPVAFLLSLLFAFLIRETYCRAQA